MKITESMAKILTDEGFTESTKKPGLFYRAMEKGYPAETAFLDFRGTGAAFVMHDHDRGGKRLVNRLLATIIAVGDDKQRRLF